MDVSLPVGTVYPVAVGCVLVGANMMELGMVIVVAESVPVGMSEVGPSEVFSGARVVVLASTVVGDCVEIGVLVAGSLLVADVDAASGYVGKGSNVAVGVTELLLGA